MSDGAARAMTAAASHPSTGADSTSVGAALTRIERSAFQRFAARGWEAAESEALLTKGAMPVGLLSPPALLLAAPVGFLWLQLNQNVAALHPLARELPSTKKRCGRTTS